MKMTKHQKRARDISWLLLRVSGISLQWSLDKVKDDFVNESTEVLDATFELMDGYVKDLEAAAGQLSKELKFLQECSCQITLRDSTQSGQHNGK